MPKRKQADRCPVQMTHSRHDRGTRTVHALTNAEVWQHLAATSPMHVDDTLRSLRGELQTQAMKREHYRLAAEAMLAAGEPELRREALADAGAIAQCTQWLDLLEAARRRGDADVALWAALLIGELIGRMKLDILRRRAPTAGGAATSKRSRTRKEETIRRYLELCAERPGRKVSWYAQRIAAMRNEDGTPVVARHWTTIRDYIHHHTK